MILRCLSWVKCKSHPCQCAGFSASSYGFHYVVLFCYLKAFITNGEDKNGSTPIPSPRTERSHPTHREAINHSCPPGFHLNSMITHPVTEHCLYQACNPVSSLQTLSDPVVQTPTPPQGRKGHLAGLLPLAWPLLGEWSPNQAVVCGLWQHCVERQLLNSTVCSRLSYSDVWELCHTQAPPFFLWPWGS